MIGESWKVIKLILETDTKWPEGVENQENSESGL